MSYNAGNLRPIDSSTGFQSFDSQQAGLDAMLHDLNVKVSGRSPVMQSRYGEGYTPTLRNVISTWAPSTENDTNNYIGYVSKNSGIDPDAPLSPEDIQRFAPHMITMEHGKEGAKQYAMADTGIMNDADPVHKDLSDEELDAKIAALQGSADHTKLSDEDLDAKIAALQGTSVAQQRYAAEDSATKSTNQNANPFSQFWTGVKTQAGRTALGVGEFANNLTGDAIFDPEVLAEAQRGADRMDVGTGVVGAMGNLAGDWRNYAGVGMAGKAATGANTLKQAILQGSKAGALGGAGAGLIEGTSDADSTVLTNAKNAGIGGVTGAGIGAALPVIGQGIKSGSKAILGGANRTMAALGSENAANRVAYSNVAKILEGQGYKPSEVSSIIDEFKAQGIEGGTLGEMLQSSDLLAREKNLVQGGGKAGKFMADKLKERPELISKSVIDKVGEQYQPEQTSYLYKEAAEAADTVPSPSAGVDGNVIAIAQSASQKELPFTMKAIEDDLAARGEELPTTALKKIQKIIQDAKNDGYSFLSVDKAKQRLADMFKENSSTTDQDTINEITNGYRKMLNDSLEAAGEEPYAFAKQSSKRDMAARNVMDAVKASKGKNPKTALNKVFGSIDDQEEFLRKLPNDAMRKEFQSYLDNLQKVTGKFQGSDTASNIATGKQMDVETGLGLDANVISPQSWIDRFSAPFSRNIRGAQAKVSFNPDTEKLTKAMVKKEFKKSVPDALPAILAVNAAKEEVNQNKPLRITIRPSDAYAKGGPVRKNLTAEFLARSKK